MIITGKNAEYRIRPADREDLSALDEVERAAAGQFSAVGLAHLLNQTLPIERLIEAQKHGHVWVVTTMTDEIVGFAMIETASERVHLEEIDILPAHSGQGLGKELIRFIQAWAVTAGFKAMSLSTFRDVPWNAPYYERLGFRILPQREWSGDLFDLRAAESRAGLPVERRVIMWKDL
jgi:GNAT superfamily N-acetyltransferase